MKGESIALYVSTGNPPAPVGVPVPDVTQMQQDKAEQTLMDFAAHQIGHPVDRAAILHFTMPIPEWVYPLWGIGVMALILALARHTIGRRGAALMVAGAYVGYRCVMWPLLLGLGVDELSAASPLVPAVKFVIRRLKLEEARELAEFAMNCESSSEILAHCQDFARKIAPGLFENN